MHSTTPGPISAPFTQALPNRHATSSFLSRGLTYPEMRADTIVPPLSGPRPGSKLNKIGWS